jgi:hypothetical protein
MINCAACKFEVSNKMRHALTKNMCPACGSALLGDFHMQRLGTIREKISLQEFSRGLDQSVIFDMSLFIMSEFFPSTPNRAVAAIASEIEDQASDLDLEKIREQVRRDALARSSARKRPELDTEVEESEELDEYESGEDESEYGEPDIPLPKSEQDLKVAKLKRLYNESPTLRKGGVSVRRIT